MYPLMTKNEKTISLGCGESGINIDTDDRFLKDSSTGDMLNMIYDGNVLKKREGQKLFASPDYDILSVYGYPFYGFILFHGGSKLLSMDTVSKEISVLSTGLLNKKGHFFSFNGFVYYIGAGNFYKVSLSEDKVSLNSQIVEGYIPTVLINCNKSGIGDSNESYNFLTGGFKVTYNTTEGEKKYIIPNAPLDSEKGVEVYYMGSKMSDSSYSVNYTTGEITFNGILLETHNQLEITAYPSEFNRDRKKIIDCNTSELFGGTNSGASDGTRIFLSGNPDCPSAFFYSGLRNPEYFPVNQYDFLGTEQDRITCMGKQYDSLIIFKERSTYLLRYIYSNNEVNFSVSQISNIYGCDCKDTLKSVGGQLTWLHSVYGVMTLSSTYIKEEKNIHIISGNINGTISENALLNQKNLNSSVSFIRKNRFYIVTKKYTYVLCMDRGFNINNNESQVWYLFDNIDAVGTVEYGNDIILAGQKGFTVFTPIALDFDMPIYAYYTTKAIDFKNADAFKFINHINFHMAPYYNSNAHLCFYDENGKLGKECDCRLKRMTFCGFEFPLFTFKASTFSSYVRVRILRRRCRLFKIRFENNEANSQMAISGINIGYKLQREARYNGI